MKRVNMLFNMVLLIGASLSFSQWSQVGDKIELSSPNDSVVIQSNVNQSTPQNKLVVNGGMQFNDKHGVRSAYIFVAPSTASTENTRADENRVNIQNAIDKLAIWHEAGVSGGTLMLMKGDFPVSKVSGESYCLIMKNGVDIKGAGRYATFIRPIENGTSYLDQLEVFRAETNSWAKLYIGNLTINAHNGKTNITGIHWGNTDAGETSTNGLIENVQIVNCTRGILVQSYGTEIRNCRINGSDNTNNKIGIALKNTYGEPSDEILNDYTNMVTIRNCEIGLFDTCIYVAGGGNKILNNLIDIKDADGGTGIYLHDEINFRGNGIHPSSQTLISNNWFQSTNKTTAEGVTTAYATGIRITECPNTVVTGNKFDGLSATSAMEFISGVPVGFKANSNHTNTPYPAPQMPDITYNNVGINTTEPRGQFDVAGNGDIYLTNNPENSEGQSIFIPGHIYIAPFGGSDVSYLQARRESNSGNTELQLRTSNNGSINDAIRIKNTGNVGIGTTSPSEKLDVNGNVKVNGKLKLNSNPTLEWGGNYLNLASPSGDNNVKVLNLKGNSSYGPRIDINNKDNAAVAIRLDGNNSATSYINNGGNFGIGTTSPSKKLDVNGSTVIRGALDVQSTVRTTANTYLTSNPNSGTGQQAFLPGEIYIAPHSNNVSYLQARRENNTGTSELQIRTTLNGNINNAVRIDEYGRVGVGTTDPQQKLDVNGNIKTSGDIYYKGKKVIVDANGYLKLQ